MSHVYKRHLAYRIFQIWEVIAFLIAFVAGIYAIDAVGLWDTDSLSLGAQLLLIAVLAAFWSLLLNNLDLYSSRRMVNRTNELAGLLFAIVIAGGSLSIVGALLEFPTNSSLFLKWFLGMASVLLIGGRVLGRAFLSAARAHGRNIRFIAVVGAGQEARKLARQLRDKPNSGIQLIGLYDDQPVLDTLEPDLPRGGTFAELKQYLMREPVDEVVIALPMASHYSEIMQTLRYCERVGVSARVINEFVNHSCQDVSLQRIDDTACLEFSSEADWGWQGKAKAIMDWVLATGALLALSPVLLIVAALIKMDSKGPVFFTQTRVGKNKRHFKLYKFRTMVPDAEAQMAKLEAQNEAGGPVFKMKNDPRVTKLGAFLRRYSIDELPQLINVVLGDMSLVGPRPLPLRDVALFEQDWYSRRFSVRPGLTCSWVLAGRSELEFDDWVQLDLDYIDNWSLVKDLNICLGTIPRVLRGSGAY